MRSQGEVAFLLATDVAARGLDILGVEAVVNFDAPAGLDGYLHRIGRTARAGEGGRALTFVEDGDRPLLKEVCADVQPEGGGKANAQTL
jgi:ATP-dependent RNA helicase DDX27